MARGSDTAIAMAILASPNSQPHPRPSSPAPAAWSDGPPRDHHPLCRSRVHGDRPRCRCPRYRHYGTGPLYIWKAALSPSPLLRSACGRRRGCDRRQRTHAGRAQRASRSGPVRRSQQTKGAARRMTGGWVIPPWPAAWGWPVRTRSGSFWTLSACASSPSPVFSRTGGECEAGRHASGALGSRASAHRSWRHRPPWRVGSAPRSRW
jgi:hypothetical protein